MLMDTPGIVPFEDRDEIRLGLVSGISPSKLEDPDLVATKLINMFKKNNSLEFEKYYGVDMSLFERMVACHLMLSDKVDTYLVDEIGIIASWSQCFITAMNRLFDSDRKVVAVIRKRENAYIREVKKRSDVELWEVTRDNRNSILTDVRAWRDG